MKYRKIGRWKYTLAERALAQTVVYPPTFIRLGGTHADEEDKIVLSPNGAMAVAEGYSWDGASGPAIDTHDFMFASLIHDALYQLMRLGLLDKSFRKDADQTLYDLCRAAGMPWWRAQYVYTAVRWFGAANADKPMEGDKDTVYEV
jgi:hypothetical protein